MEQGKLVRDKIPEIIIADGEKPISGGFEQKIFWSGNE